MTDLNYALEPRTYTLYNAMLWGNFKGHCKKVTQGKLGHRLVHLFIAIIQFPPIVSQIASLFEMVIVRSCLFKVRREHRTRVNISVKNELTEKDKGSNTSSPVKTPKKGLIEIDQSTQNPIDLPNVTPEDLAKLSGTGGTPSPSGSDLSETPSTDSETPISIPLTASMQLEKARLEKQNKDRDICIVA